MTLYRIRDWRKHFEVNRTRELKHMTWFPCPNSLDGSGYRELISMHRNGPAHYAAWVVLLAVASKCAPRGTLVRSNGKPHDAASIASMSGFDAALIAEALERLILIGWVDEIPQDGATIQDTERNGNNEFPIGNSCGELQATSPPPVLTFPVVGGKHEWHLTQAKLDEYAESFPAVDVLRECKAARQWCIDKPRNRKTYSGMPAFLSRWLTKAQNSARPVNGSTQNLQDEMNRRLGVQDA